MKRCMKVRGRDAEIELIETGGSIYVYYDDYKSVSAIVFHSKGNSEICTSKLYDGNRIIVPIKDYKDLVENLNRRVSKDYDPEINSGGNRFYFFRELCYDLFGERNHGANEQARNVARNNIEEIGEKSGRVRQLQNTLAEAVKISQTPEAHSDPAFDE